MLGLAVVKDEGQTSSGHNFYLPARCETDHGVVKRHSQVGEM
jgi:hypothetical protein